MTANLRSRLLQLDAQIVEQTRFLNELQQARSDVERELHANAIFPVLTLPPEITAEIFIRLLGLCPLRIPGENPAPAVLASVCRQWRDIALATPVLWSELEVHFDHIARTLISESGLVEGHVDQWLARSGNRPLSLNFQCWGIRFALGRLRDLIHRWSQKVQYLQLYIRSHDFGALELESATFPLLQRVALGCDEDGSGLVLSTAPCFHDLRVLWSGFGLNSFTLPWPQLTKFAGVVLYDMELFTLAPNLTDIKCLFDLNHDASLPIITHCNLISLTTDPLAGILRYVTLPALRYLDVSIHDEDSYEPGRHEDSTHPLHSFLVRSSPPLVTLSLSFLEDAADGYNVESHRLAQCMRLVGRTLESLECWKISSDLMPSIFDNLRPDSLPNLRTLSFKDVDGPLNLPIFIHVLYRFDKLRTAVFVWESSLLLDRTITVYTSTATHRMDTISGHLSHLAQKGMKIYLGTDEKNYFSNGNAAIGQHLI